MPAAPGQAVRHHQQALDLARAIGNGYAEALIGLAATHRQAGNPELAAEHAAEAVAVARQGGYQVVEGNATTTLAATRFALGCPETARELAQHAVAIQAGTGHRLG